MEGVEMLERCFQLRLSHHLAIAVGRRVLIHAL